MDEDYNECPSTIGPLSGGQRRACINVDINDDPIPEEPENFTAVLLPSPDPLISLDPTRTETVVTIGDNDGKIDTWLPHCSVFGKLIVLCPCSD